jgi:hypothetical protein
MTTHSHSSIASWAGYGAATWALIFAIFHLIWATGWYIGLDTEQARIAFAKTPFLVYDLVVAGICAFAVAVALALAMSWGQRLPRRLVSLFAWGGTGLLGLRAGGGIIQGIYEVVTGTFSLEPSMWWELWFVLGAILFTVSLWHFQQMRK